MAAERIAIAVAAVLAAFVPAATRIEIGAVATMQPRTVERATAEEQQPPRCQLRGPVQRRSALPFRARERVTD